MNNVVEECRLVVTEALKKNVFQGVLFSGGLDSAIVAVLKPVAVCITVSLGQDSDDIPYAQILAKRLNLHHFHRKVEEQEAIEAIPEVIRILKSFDPALPNDLAAYFGLVSAKELGIGKVATGDASDELFGGYSFMQELDDLDGYIRRITQTMTFSSNDIAEFLGIEVIQPYVDKKIVDFALKVPANLKIRKGNGTVWGKWILRKAFEGILPQEILWQNKRPLEYGSGMNKLRRIISERVSDKEFNEDSSGVKFMSKEHFYYYQIYKRVVGEMPRPEQRQKRCPCCGAGMEIDSFHCKVCGGILDLDWGD
jgi:asparagine synthase (glutamine-hydrolysing)